MRTRRQDRPKAKRLSLPTSVVTKVDEQLSDPFTGAPPFGAWANLITQLLVKWLAGEIEVAIKRKFKPKPFCPNCLADLPPDATYCEVCNEGDNPAESAEGPA